MVGNTERFVDQFVGRTDILNRIQAAIDDIPQRYVIRILGEGGVGKTALLRKLSRVNQYNSSVVVFAIDYSQARFQSLPSIANTLIEQLLDNNLLSKEGVNAFQNKLTSAQEAFKAGEPVEVVNNMSMEAYLLAIEEVNQALQQKKKRLLILSDSIEYSTDIEKGKRINKLGSLIQNTVIVVAGRPKAFVIERLEQEYETIFGNTDWIMPDIEVLENFNLDNTIAYFEQILRYPPDEISIKKIHKLTNGKPVLLAFVAEWLKRHITLPDALNKIDKESEISDHLQSKFEYELVAQMRELQQPLDNALLKLAYLWRRYDKRILKIVLDITFSEVEQMEPELYSMAFVRSFIDDSSGLLHDEAKSLITKYAWPYHDPTGTERRNLARRIIDEFYLPEIKRLRKKIVEATVDAYQERVAFEYSSEYYQVLELEIECLDYAYRLSDDYGRKYLTELIQEELSIEKEDAIYQALFEISKSEAQMAQVRMNLRRGILEGVDETLRQKLEDAEISSWYKIVILQELSELPLKTDERVTLLEEALKLARQLGDIKETARLHNTLGLMYRRQGLWEKAEKEYQKVIRLLNTNREDPQQLASTLNNLAFVHLLRGDLNSAETLVAIALKKREEIGHQLGIAFSYLTKGSIAFVKGDLSEANHAYSAATTLFEKAGRKQYQADAQIYLSALKRVEQKFDEAEVLLKAGLSLNEPGLYAIRARAEREFGAICRDRAMRSEDESLRTSKLAEAVQSFIRALSFSERRNDWHGQAQVLLDLVFLSYLTNKQVNEAYANKLEKILSSNNYPIIGASLLEIRASVMYDQGNIAPAFREYIQVGQTLSRYHKRKFDRICNRFRTKFLAQDTKTQTKLCEVFNNMPKGETQEMSLFLSSLCIALQVAGLN
jgi:hypothetical protein